MYLIIKCNYNGSRVSLFINSVIRLVVIFAVAAIPTLLFDFLLGFLTTAVDSYVGSR